MIKVDILSKEGKVDFTDSFAWVSLASIFYFFFWFYSWESKAFVFSHPFGSNYNDSDLLAA